MHKPHELVVVFGKRNHTRWINLNEKTVVAAPPCWTGTPEAAGPNKLEACAWFAKTSENPHGT